MTRSRLVLTALTLAASLALTACSSAKPAAPAAPAAPAFKQLVVVDSVVRGSTNLTAEEKAAGKSCVLNSRFLRNEQVVWRIKVIDPVTGKELDDQGLDKVQVKLGDGQTLTAKFGIRPKDKPTDGFWTTSFNIPADYPPGTLNYGVEVSGKDGRTGQFVKFAMASSALVVLPEVRPAIAAPPK